MRTGKYIDVVPNYLMMQKGGLHGSIRQIRQGEYSQNQR